MSNQVNTDIEEKYYEEAEEHLYAEGYRGELLKELIIQDVNYRLEYEND